MQLELTDGDGTTWVTTKAALADEFNRRLGAVRAQAEINSRVVMGEFSWSAWERGVVVQGADISHRSKLAQIVPEWIEVQQNLQKTFSDYSLKVHVELTPKGLIIRSEDDRVSMQEASYVFVTN